MGKNYRDRERETELRKTTSLMITKLKSNYHSIEPVSDTSPTRRDAQPSEVGITATICAAARAL